MLLGTHESVAGGLDKAFEHAEAHGDEAIQIFTKNSNQWKEPSLGPAQIAAFRSAHASWGGRPVISHGSYLVNLCTEKLDILERSRDTVAAEMVRCEELGVAGIAFHPGAALALSDEDALDRIAEGLSVVLERTRGMKTRLFDRPRGTTRSSPSSMPRSAPSASRRFISMTRNGRSASASIGTKRSAWGRSGSIRFGGS
jgi:deoxyribonuclease-4